MAQYEPYRRMGFDVLSTFYVAEAHTMQCGGEGQEIPNWKTDVIERFNVEGCIAGTDFDFFSERSWSQVTG